MSFLGLRLLTGAGAPAKSFSPISLAKWFNFANGMSLLVPCITRNLGHRYGSSVFEEGSTTYAHVLCEWRFLEDCCWFAIFSFSLFRHIWSLPTLESNKGMHIGIIISMCTSVIQLCYTSRRQCYQGEASGEVSSVRLPKATPSPNIDISPTSFW